MTEYEGVRPTALPSSAKTSSYTYKARIPQQYEKVVMFVKGSADFFACFSKDSTRRMPLSSFLKSAFADALRDEEQRVDE